VSIGNTLLLILPLLSASLAGAQTKGPLKLEQNDPAAGSAGTD